MLKSGTCRWCKCTEERACPSGCSWVDRIATICSACAPVEQAWSDEPKRLPNMKKAFFRGFLFGAKDSRAEDTANPYVRSGGWQDSWAWFEKGRLASAGAIAGR